MSRHNRILVRYRLPESNDQWSELQWCDIEKNAEHGSIEVRVAPAQDAVMPEDTAFTVLPQGDAKKLLVWDVAGESNHAYCLVIQANALYRFDFNPATNLLMQGQYWSLEENDYDKNQPVLGIKTTFNQESQIDQRLAMRTHETYNYTQLTDKAEKLPALTLQYRAWQQKVIQDREREAADQEQQKQLAAERLREAAERYRKQKEADERMVERHPDHVIPDRLLPSCNDPDEDANIARLLQEDEIANALPGMRFSPMYEPEDLEYEYDYVDVARLQPARDNQRQLENENPAFGDAALAAELQNQEFRQAQWAHGRSSSPAFFAQHGAGNPPPRPPRPELKRVILALMGASLIGYGLYMLAYTSPWIGIGVIGLAALCVCAAVLGRRPPPGAAERAQPPAIFGYHMGNMW